MGKVFWGVLLALIVFSALAFVGRAVFVASLAAAAQHELETAHQQQQQQQQAQRVALQRAQAADLQRRQLAPDERCVAGTVVRITASSYTQVAGVGGRLVACSGRYRLP